jgi:uncharacterized peroxidase-related enzyme
MPRVTLIDPSDTTPDRAALLHDITAAFGTTPAMFRAAANSPAALRSLWGAFGALSGGSLSAVVTEQIAVAVADRNRCEYCLAAHTALGRKAGATASQMADAQRGASDDPRTAAILRFARALVDDRGDVGDNQVAAVRSAGVDDEALVEVVAHVALNLFTNYLNVALAVPVDFPHVSLTDRA